MSADFLPKSLHTVRILVNVARELRSHFTVSGLGGESADVYWIRRAAGVCGYSVKAGTRDPLILKAAAQLAAGN